MIVVDDQSRDGTLAAARDGGRRRPARDRGRRARRCRTGWVGKSWACWQGVQRATGDWLLFTDADVVHAPDSLGRTMAMARRLGRGGLTMFPTDRVRGRRRAGRDARRAGRDRDVRRARAAARTDDSRVAIAAGGYILVKRRLYDAVGGHLGIRSRMVDDVCLAAARQAVRRAARAGARRPAWRGCACTTAPREVWQGWSKNASFAVGRPAGEGAGRAPA